MWVAFALQKLLTFFQQKISAYLDVNFNESLTNDVVSFEQLGPDFQYLQFMTCFTLALLITSRETQTSFILLVKLQNAHALLNQGFPLEIYGDICLYWPKL